MGSTVTGDAGNTEVVLGHRGSGYSQFRVLLSEARSVRYPTWLAEAGIVGSSGGTNPNAKTNTKSKRDGLTQLGEYDYIVVGGGAAGLVGS